jgi:hypothetical protein
MQGSTEQRAQAAMCLSSGGGHAVPQSVPYQVEPCHGKDCVTSWEELRPPGTCREELVRIGDHGIEVGSTERATVTRSKSLEIAGVLLETQQRWGRHFPRHTSQPGTKARENSKESRRLQGIRRRPPPRLPSCVFPQRCLMLDIVAALVYNGIDLSQIAVPAHRTRKGGDATRLLVLRGEQSRQCAI